MSSRRLIYFVFLSLFSRANIVNRRAVAEHDEADKLEIETI